MFTFAPRPTARAIRALSYLLFSKPLIPNLCTSKRAFSRSNSSTGDFGVADDSTFYKHKILSLTDNQRIRLTLVTFRFFAGSRKTIVSTADFF